MPVILFILLRFRFASPSPLDCRKGWARGHWAKTVARTHAVAPHPWTADPGRWDHVDGALTILAAQWASSLQAPLHSTQKSPSKA
jgi:hypothetical protein